MKTPTLWIAMALLAAGLMSGCALFNDDTDNRPAPQLARDGMDAFRIGRYQEAMETFQKLKDFFPFSKYAMLAELKTADAHFKLDEYEEAIQAYEEFENLHPRNEATPYAAYRIGMCYFEQVDAPDRDQTSAEKALESFQRLQKQYPTSPYALRADAFIQQCYRSLAAAEFSVGRHYYKTKHYKGAMARFRTVVKQYPDAGVHHEALQYMAMCREKLADK